MREWENMSNLTNDFSSWLEDCSYNHHKLNKHGLHFGDGVRVKVEQHRKDTSRQAFQLQGRITAFLTSLSTTISAIPQQISDFVEIVHQSFRTLRTHFRKELPHFLVLSENCFTSLKDSLEQFVT